LASLNSGKLIWSFLDKSDFRSGDSMEKEFLNLLVYCQSNHRVCPKSVYWNVVRCFLPPTADGEKPPPLPVIFDESLRTSEIMKQFVFRKHIQWAYDYGVLEKVDRYLRSLSEDQ
jgi:hypothetical protein